MAKRQLAAENLITSFFNQNFYVTANLIGTLLADAGSIHQLQVRAVINNLIIINIYFSG